MQSWIAGADRGHLELVAGAQQAVTPEPRTAKYQPPDLISTTAAASMSAIVGSGSSSGASATATQADSSPAIAGRVPSIGSTTNTCVASPGDTSPRSSE